MNVIRSSTYHVDMRRQCPDNTTYVVKYPRQIFLLHNRGYVFSVKNDVNVDICI